MKFYCEDSAKVLGEVGSTREGLSSAEAAERLEKNGKNKLAAAKGKSLIRKFLEQLAEPMTIILLVAAAISAGTEIYSGIHEGFEFPWDVVIILAVVIINAVLGVIQESKAEKAIEALQEMSAATSKVLRDGRIQIVHSEDLVLGDIILLEAGDAVPADARIIECASMKVEEAALTGESVPVTKQAEALTLEARIDKQTEAVDLGKQSDVPLGDRKNMLYMGSTVVYGRGTAVVVATGMDTEMGKIADALSQAEEGKTPLQIKLAQLSKILTVLVIGICVLVFGINVIKSLATGGGFSFTNVLDFFMIAISLAVAAIPEGLATVVTIVLSIGVTNMSRRNAIIRRLTAVETLGCTQIICSDKTGTLTQNKMTVVDHFGEDEGQIASAMALCCDAEIDTDGNVTGEPTEAALVVWADRLGMKKYDLKASYPRTGEAPFDSGRKMMSTVHSADGKFIQYTKGAPDVVIGKCTHYLEGGAAVPMTEEYKASILSANKEMADKALRVLACSMRVWDSAPADYEAATLEEDLCFVGLCGMIDPVRPEVKDAIVECRSAGIRPIMITGDHVDTAVAIAKELGIITEGTYAITGAQLSEMDDAQFEAEFMNISVYARVQPEHKTRIVNAWRNAGYVTAMTGDGVNDAPSIKSADIGVGMGITGTDVTKNVADMILADDNFATIVSAVGEGRRIYDNIKKAIQFLLASNLSEVLTILLATFLLPSGVSIFLPIHLLFINLITDSLPALALGMEEPEADIMRRKPRKSNEGVFADGVGFAVAYQGLLVTVITLVSYFIGYYVLANKYGVEPTGLATTMAFLTLSMAEIFHSFNMRSLHGSIFTMKNQNKWLLGAGVLSLILTTLVVEVPFLSKIFEFAHLNWTEYLIALGLAILTIPVVELVKLIQRRTKK